MNKKTAGIITLNLFNKCEIECILHTDFLKEQEIKAACEIELLKVYGTAEKAIKDVTIIEILYEGNGDVIICFQTKTTEKISYYGTHGHMYRFKYGTPPDVIKSSLGLGELNIVKFTCKELGITYRELGEAIGYSGDTLNNAARSEKVSVPLQKAIELYKKTLEQEKELQKLATLRTTLKSILD